ncbi:uncharacterized protein LOC126800670 [Argentina anserina]|uniref:uncharacterized protein LOC126800670 n=1 Tax=Argentina anserina TaxID=57926 RepID=UPI0021769063|nr:uncharacterized protein LOC126800670 [Potentilla anserina]
MKFKGFILLGLLSAVIFISSIVAAAETSKHDNTGNSGLAPKETKSNQVEDSKPIEIGRCGCCCRHNLWGCGLHCCDGRGRGTGCNNAVGTKAVGGGIPVVGGGIPVVGGGIPGVGGGIPGVGGGIPGVGGVPGVGAGIPVVGGGAPGVGHDAPRVDKGGIPGMRGRRGTGGGGRVGGGGN